MRNRRPEACGTAGETPALRFFGRRFGFQTRLYSLDCTTFLALNGF